jgi:hypothetical protein
MVRFFILGSRGEGDNSWGVRLHHILSSDDDSLFHNHPYNFVSFILWGGYTEYKPGSKSRRFHIGNINKSSIDEYHRLELDRPAWTLVFTGRRQADWGFWSGERGDPFIPWKEHK